MNTLTTFKAAGLPAVKDLASALKTNLPSVAGAGTVIIKMDKTGHWVFGGDMTEIEPDSKWAVNPFSFIHGYIAWGDGDVLGEKMAPISQPLPELDVAPPGAKKGWETQVGLSIKCINGDDKDMEARYTTTSVGGKRAVQTLGVAIAQQIDKDPSKPVAIITLGKEHYNHKSYGRIYTPVFTIVDWVSMEVENEIDEQLEMEEPTEVEETITPVRRRRTAV
jgi:hypothetical protein